VELKNGETYNGHLVTCDSWMNINLREVICTSKVSIVLKNNTVTPILFLLNASRQHTSQSYGYTAG